ncbi:MAG: hypothetical protein ISR65_10880 [Bacteriovoracaceae bacterium]|nr:hypothetical protein [Bacteriovoracaceae bacterium]
MKKNDLLKEEKTTSDQLAKGKYKSVSKREKSKYAHAAKSEINRRKEVRKEKRINVRLTNEDLVHLKDKAQQEGLPYQTLVTSIIHKYLNGYLIDVNNVSVIKKLLKV